MGKSNHKKWLITTSFILVYLIGNFAFGQEFQWVKTFGSLKQDQISDMCTDKQGYLYVLGTFNDTLKANPSDPAFPVPNSVMAFNPDSNRVVPGPVGWSQIFLAKFNPQGQVVWLKNFGTESYDGSSAILIDKAGDIIISGGGGANLRLNQTDTSFQYTSPGNVFGFIAKLDNNGNLKWKTLFDFGLGNFDRGIAFNKMVCTSNNQIMVVGGVSNNFLVVHNEVIINTIYAGMYQGMFMKLAEDGKPVFFNFSSCRGDAAYANFTSLAINRSDEVVITGSFDDTLDLVQGNPAATIIKPQESFAYRMFFAKFSANGQFKWVKAIEGYPYTSASDVVFDAYDNLYFTGIVGPQPQLNFTVKETDFDPDTGRYIIPRFTFNNSNANGFLASYSNEGKIRWAHWFYGPDNDTYRDGEVRGTNLEIDAAGRIYMGGSTRCNILDVNPGPTVVPLVPGINGTMRNSPPNPFILRFMTDKTYLRQRIFYSSEGSATINAFTCDTIGNLFAGGYFTHIQQFNYPAATPAIQSLNSDTVYLGSWTLPNSQDMFITKHSNCTQITNISQTICEGDSFLFNGYQLKLPGRYPRFNSIINDCEHVQILTLKVLPKHASYQNIRICFGDTFTIGNQNLTNRGFYTSILNSANGCDSVVTTNLMVDTLKAEISTIACSGYTWNNESYTESGTFKKWFNTANGCDSLAILNLTILAPKFRSQVINLCPGSTFMVGARIYSTPGIYKDTLTASNGCDSIITSTLNYSIPSDSIKITDNTFSAANNQDSYQWLDCNQNFQTIPGANQQTFTPPNNGHYAVRTTKGNCADTSNCVLFTSAKDLLSSQIRIYPQPVKDKLYIDMPETSQSTELVLMDPLGRIVLKEKGRNIQSISVLRLPAGLYQLKVLRGKEMQVFGVMVEK